MQQKLLPLRYVQDVIVFSQNILQFRLRWHLQMGVLISLQEPHGWRALEVWHNLTTISAFSILRTGGGWQDLCENMAPVARLAQIWPKNFWARITVTAQHDSNDNSPHHHVACDQSKGLTIQLIRSGREGIGRLGIKFMAHEPRLAPSSSPSYILHSAPSYIEPILSPSYILHSALLLHRTHLVAFLHLT